MTRVPVLKTMKTRKMEVKRALSDSGKKQSLEKKIKDETQIQEQEKNFIFQEYMPFLERKGVNSDGTKANYLQSLYHLTKESGENINELAELSEQRLEDLNNDIVDQIQANKFKKQSGGLTKRRKKHFWTTWRRIMEVQNIDVRPYNDYIPETDFSVNDKVVRQADTRPEDIPTPDQVKEFVKKLGEQSEHGCSLRNQALIMLLWDKGPRIGEALSLKMKHVSVEGKKVKINFDNQVTNKRSKDREVLVLQGRKLLKDYIQKHEMRDQDEALLFPKVKSAEYFSELSKKPLRRKIHRAAKDISFKTDGEPFHIFRKGYYTSQVANEWASWEETCSMTGKKDDGTKPEYLKLALQDVNASTAGKIGADIEIKEEDGSSRMDQPPLLPKDCPSCGKKNQCIQEVCAYCGTELPESKMPKGGVDDKKEDVKTTVKQSGGMTDQQIENLVESKIDKMKEDFTP